MFRGPRIARVYDARHRPQGARTSMPHTRQVLRFPLFAAAIFSRCSTVAKLRCENETAAKRVSGSTALSIEGYANPNLLNPRLG